MAQQINLLNPALRPQKRHVSARQAVVGVLVMLGVMVAYGYSTGRALKSAEIRRDTASDQLKKAQAEMTVLAAQPAPSRDKQLEEEILRLERAAKGREALLGRIDGGFGNLKGFSGHLEALSRRAIEGLWLTRITLKADEDDFALQGRVLRADLISQYIGQLSQEPVLRGRKLAQMNLAERELPLPVAPPVAQVAASAPPGATTPASAPRTVRVIEFTLGSAPAGGDGREDAAKAAERR